MISDQIFGVYILVQHVCTETADVEQSPSKEDGQLGCRNNQGCRVPQREPSNQVSIELSGRL